MENNEHSKQLTRRDILKGGVGLVGAYVALKSNLGAASAQGLLGSGPTSNLKTAPLASMTAAAAGDWSDVEAALGNTKGMMKDNGVFMIDLPRKDLNVTIAGVPVQPEMGVETELAFRTLSKTSMVKYEIALLEAEVAPVISAMIEQKLPISAVHNHFLKSNPVVIFMHGTAFGSRVDLANRLRTAVSRSATPFGGGDEPAGNPGFDAAQVAQMVGGKGIVQNGVLTVNVPRRETFIENGTPEPSSMMVETILKFQSIGNGQAAMGGEIPVLASELERVVQALRGQGVLVTAIHNHELLISPIVYYVHTWATNPITTLARSARTGLNYTRSRFV